MEIVFGAPQYYVQSPNILASMPKYTQELNVHNILVLSDKGVARYADIVLKALQSKNVCYDARTFEDQITLEKINILVDSIQQPYDAVMGLGGGKAIDVAKRISWAKKIKMIAVPTSVATDACTSRTAVAYGQNNEIVEDKTLQNPDAVIVDSQVIVNAPVRLFRAGMADAISKRFEYILSLKCGQPNWYGGAPAFFIDGISDRMHSFLLKEGRYLQDCFERHTLNETVEKGITAMLLMSRLVWDVGGLRGAHDMFEEFHDMGYGHDTLHGEIVGFFDLVHIMLEDYPENEFEELYALYRDLHIPLKLSQMGFPVQDTAKLDALIGRMLVKCAKFDYYPTAQRFKNVILALESRTQMEGCDRF